VAELADAGDLKSPDPKGRVGSIPTPGTNSLEIVSCKLKIEVLLDNHRRFLAFVEKRVGDRALAEDILQDAFVRSMDKAEGVPDDALVPWFYATLRNAVIDRYRRGETQSRALEAFGQELERERDAAGDLDREICACVTRVAKTLKPEYADALARVELDGASLKEYASQTGLTPNNAGVRVHRARQALKRKMMESCGLCAEHGCVDCTCGPR
jgi:RNA polymerase sigma factor (sigma-70 family)